MAKCTNCGETYADTETYAGHSITCPGCHTKQANATPSKGLRKLMEQAARSMGFRFGV